MEKRTLEVAAVTITAHQQALLQVPDPQLRGGLRVPLGEGNDIGWSADDWTRAWEYGSTEFSDDYAAQHYGQQPPKEDLEKIGQYLYVNKCDPMSPSNWEKAYERLQAAGVIFDPVALADIAQAFEDKSQPQAPKQLTPAEFAKEVATAMEKIDTRTPEGRKQLNEIRQKYLLLEAGPVYDRFIADLESRGVYLTRLEQQQLLEWVQNNNLVLTQRQSLERALRALFPKYLNEEERAIIDMDHNDSITSADLKKALGTASPRVGYAVQNK